MGLRLEGVFSRAYGGQVPEEGELRGMARRTAELVPELLGGFLENLYLREWLPSGAIVLARLGHNDGKLKVVARCRSNSIRRGI